MIVDEFGNEYKVSKKAYLKWYLQRFTVFFTIVFGLGLMLNTVIFTVFALKGDTDPEFSLFFVYYIFTVLGFGILVFFFYYLYYTLNTKKSIEDFNIKFEASSITISTRKFNEFIVEYSKIRKVKTTKNISGLIANLESLNIIVEGDYEEFVSPAMLLLMRSKTPGLEVNGLIIKVDGLKHDIAESLKQYLLHKIPKGSLDTENIHWTTKMTSPGKMKAILANFM